VRQRVVLFCGAGTGPVYQTTWEFDGKAWKQVATTGPAASGVHALAYDKVRQVTVLFGGMVENRQKAGDPRDYFADAWSWVGKDWRKLDAPPAPQSNAMDRGALILEGVVDDGFSKMRGSIFSCSACERKNLHRRRIVNAISKDIL